MSDCLKTYEGLLSNDDILKKERAPPSWQQMATLADQFQEARLGRVL